MKKIGVFMLTLLSVLMLTACGKNERAAKDSYPEIEQSGELVIGLDDTFAPMSYRDDQGEIVGFDVDLAKAVAQKLDLKVTFQAIDWSMKETELNAGNIDLIWNGYTITDERKEKVAFSIPYLDNTQAIIVLKDSPIQTKIELKQKIVAAQQSSSAVDAVNHDKDLAADQLKELLQYPSNNDVFNDLEAKRSEAAVADEVLARYYIQLKGESKYRILTDHFGKEEYGVGIRKSDKKLKEKVDQALTELKEDGSYQKIYQKWFGE
ncbi:amino acid ABC transporter substrate-binding protein [Isobaculum melis]|uniref:Amino acid ABC transporter substrate-binding protein, PAAT family n=1 Tax=Isobaculum melis TaxID=142588 RepID=A0A1H9RGH3_9LACT|nr:amino acid ABC transporter substrate-binding protein [Isobaculum melis]SER71910.1 amino acid ABC transporter substrate-binding protein, PAAT family [Isobaculum melis]